MDEQIMSSNFIHDFIDEDLKEGVYDHVQTRFSSGAQRLSAYRPRKGDLHNLGTAQKYGGVLKFASR